MWKVILEHFGPEYIKGDLEEKFESNLLDVFSSKKEAKDYILKKLKNKIHNTTKWTRTGSGEFITWYTGTIWENENSGAINKEYYSYIIRKK